MRHIPRGKYLAERLRRSPRKLLTITSGAPSVAAGLISAILEPLPIMLGRCRIQR
jgi:hypothetical protein